MSTPSYNPQRVQSLLDSFVDLNNAMRSVAQELRDGLSELHTRSAQPDVLVHASSGTTASDQTLGTSNQDKRGANLTGDNEKTTVHRVPPTPLVDSSSNINIRKRNDGPEITVPLMKFVESMTMLPQQLSDDDLKTYLSSIKELTGNMSQETFTREKTHQDEDQENTNTRTMVSAASPAVKPIVRGSGSRSVPVFLSRGQASPIQPPVEKAPIKALWTSVQPVFTQTVFGKLKIHGDPKAALLVHLLKTKMPAPKALIVYHQEYNMTVIRDQEDKYAVLTGPISVDIEKGVMKGTLTVDKIIQSGLVENPVLMDVTMVDGLEIEYQEAGNLGNKENIEPISRSSERVHEEAENGDSATSTEVVEERLLPRAQDQVSSNNTEALGPSAAALSCKAVPPSTPQPATPRSQSPPLGPISVVQIENIAQVVPTTSRPNGEVPKQEAKAVPLTSAAPESTKRKTKGKRGREEDASEKTRELPSRVKRQKRAVPVATNILPSLTSEAAGPSQTTTTIYTTAEERPAVRRSRRLLKEAVPPIETPVPTVHRTRGAATVSRSKGKQKEGTESKK